MSVNRFDIMRSILLRGAGLNGKRVFLQSPAEVAAARAQGRNVYTLPGSSVSYYIDTTNLSDSEINELVPLKKLGFLAYIAGQLPLLRRILYIIAALLAALIVLVGVLIVAVILK